MKTLSETIQLLTTEEGFSWGTNSVMRILRPNCVYEMVVSEGNFNITKWGDNWSDETQRYLEPPTSQELRDEYVRQQTISECIDYFKEKK